MKFLKIFLLACAFLFTGCAPWHAAYLATNSELSMEEARTASAKLYTIFWLFTFGDASLEKLQRESNIKKIHHIDIEGSSILFVIRTYKVTLYGE